MKDKLYIHDMLKTNLYTVEGVRGNLAMENMEFDPKGKSIWFTEAYQPNGNIPVSVGSNGSMKYIGLYTVNVYIPIGQGTSSAIIKSVQIEEAFNIGKKLKHNTTSVHIDNSYASEGISSGQWWVVPYTVEWSCFMRINKKE